MEDTSLSRDKAVQQRGDRMWMFLERFGKFVSPKYSYPKTSILYLSSLTTNDCLLLVTFGFSLNTYLPNAASRHHACARHLVGKAGRHVQS